MGLGNIFGIPAHPLIVHAVVVLVPLAALGAIAVVASPWVRAHVGWLVAAAAVLNVLLVPLATGSGESLEERVKETALVETHAEMGEQLLPWVIALAVGIVLFMVFARLTARHSTDGPPPAWAPRWVGIVVVVVTVIAASGALVQVARIGHSGAKASWSDAAGVARPAASPHLIAVVKAARRPQGVARGPHPLDTRLRAQLARAVALGAGAVNTARAVRVREPPAVSACSYADHPAEP